MSKRGNEMLIDDMLDSSEQILKYTNSMTFEQFLSDRMVMDAVIRNFEIIGEAANKLSDDFKDTNPQIDWHRIRGFRNRIVHDYSGIDYSLVWEIRNELLTDFIAFLRTC